MKLPLKICIYVKKVYYLRHFEVYEELPLYPGIFEAVLVMKILRNLNKAQSKVFEDIITCI